MPTMVTTLLVVKGYVGALKTRDWPPPNSLDFNSFTTYGGTVEKEVDKHQLITPSSRSSNGKHQNLSHLHSNCFILCEFVLLQKIVSFTFFSKKCVRRPQRS